LLLLFDLGFLSNILLIALKNESNDEILLGSPLFGPFVFILTSPSVHSALSPQSTFSHESAMQKDFPLLPRSIVHVVLSGHSTGQFFGCLHSA
jgi:hypothetical protein